MAANTANTRNNLMNFFIKTNNPIITKMAIESNTTACSQMSRPSNISKTWNKYGSKKSLIVSIIASE
jgi:hypothetical protein